MATIVLPVQGTYVAATLPLRRARSVLLLAAILPLIASCGHNKATTPRMDLLSIASWDVLPADPISAVGHGAIIGADGREASPSVQDVLQAQAFYLKRLVAADDQDLVGELRYVQETLNRESDIGLAEQAAINHLLILALVERVRPLDGSAIASKSTALLAAVASRGTPDAARIRSKIMTALQATKLVSALESRPAPDRAAYVRQCLEAGVPTPPDWGTREWKSMGLLKQEFISEELEAELFVYESAVPAGICLALPRSVGNQIGLLGIICLGTESSKSCFWDNQENDFTVGFQKGIVKPLSEFAGGPELFGGQGDVCTDCHAGENPFVVHPGDAMDLGPKLNPKSWPKPLVHPDWPQNEGPSTVLNEVSSAGKCTSCHKEGGPGGRFPTLSPKLKDRYCKEILEKAFERTMPPDGQNKPSYEPQVKALLAECEPKLADGTVCAPGTTCNLCVGGSSYWPGKGVYACGQEPKWEDGKYCALGTSCNACQNTASYWPGKAYIACGQDPNKWEDGKYCALGTSCNACQNTASYWHSKGVYACGQEPKWEDGKYCALGTSCNNCQNAASYWPGNGYIACGQEPKWEDGKYCALGTSCNACQNAASYWPAKAYIACGQDPNKWEDGKYCALGTSCNACQNTASYWHSKAFTACGQEPKWEDGKYCALGTSCNACQNAASYWPGKAYIACGQEPKWPDGTLCALGTTCNNCQNAASYWPAKAFTACGKP